MNINKLNNLAFSAKYLYQGKKENLNKVVIDCQDNKDKELLFLNDCDKDVLLVATSNDAKVLRKNKEIPNFTQWIDSIRNLGDKNYLNNVCRFIFKTNQGVVLCNADKSSKPSDKIVKGDIKFLDGTTLHVQDKKAYAKSFPDKRTEYYTKEGKIKAIKYENGTMQKNFYNASGKDLLFSLMPNGEIISEEGMPNYDEGTVTFKKPDGSIFIYDFAGALLKATNIKNEKPNQIFRKFF